MIHSEIVSHDSRSSADILDKIRPTLVFPEFRMVFADACSPQRPKDIRPHLDNSKKILSRFVSSPSLSLHIFLDRTEYEHSMYQVSSGILARATSSMDGCTSYLDWFPALCYWIIALIFMINSGLATARLTSDPPTNLRRVTSVGRIQQENGT